MQRFESHLFEKKIQEILVFDEVRSKFTNLIEKFEKICYPLDLNRLFFSIQVIFDAQEIFNTFTKLLQNLSK